MSDTAKVVPISRGRRRAARPKAKAAPGAFEQRVHELERELRAERETKRPDSLLVALARAVSSGTGALDWASLGRLQRALYFAWHSEETDAYGADARFAERLEPFLEFLYAMWWRVEATGTEHVPARGAGLVVANHSGVLPYDGLMVQLAIKHEHPARRLCRMLALDMFALLPILAPMLSKSGSVRASPENAERLLREGELLGVFPEGVKGIGKRYRERYKLARFGRGGFVRVALRTGTPIIPCAIVGAEEIHPVVGKADWLGRPFGLPYFPLTPTFPWLGPLGLLPLPTKWSIDFGEPIDLGEHGPEGAEDPILVNRIAESVRETIQRMVDGRLARRRSIWFG
ncbi:MAG: lysophospholipid acyltransferase family protein [Burkholderiales bacterium]|jgi:1-acyl-sn-glycerol-3-phosphate acyltransferase